jgi:hypothetical protein
MTASINTVLCSYMYTTSREPTKTYRTDEVLKLLVTSALEVLKIKY